MKDKKSFLLYCDQKEMFEHLPDALCKKLLMHLFCYVNDENPKTDDPILNALFAPIKHQLKRDLKKWEERASTSRENGKLGGRPPKPTETHDNPDKPSGLFKNPEEPAKPVTVNVTVNDTVNVKETIKGINRSFDHLSITNDEFNKLIQTYSVSDVNEILDDIKNYSKNKQYKSLYLTARKWLKKNKQENSRGTHKNIHLFRS